METQMNSINKTKDDKKRGMFIVLLNCQKTFIKQKHF